ncbi:MAG: O-acetyl-ADP-ribose deacetylase [Fulvivirga sp.]
MSITIQQGDITQLEVDAIVNAANPSLLGGGGVDGAIHRAAGPQLLEYNNKLSGCKTGEAKLSPGYDLPSKYVISTVGPVWKGGQTGEALLLQKCYTNSLILAHDNNLKTIAFPAISTGVYGFPFKQAATIAITTLQKQLALIDYKIKVTLIFFSNEDYHQAISIKNKLNPS